MPLPPSIEWWRVVDIRLRFYDDATFSHTRRGTDAKCQYLVTTALAAVAGWHPCSGKSLGWSSQLVGGHLLKYN
ncbi:MAG: hypothetical protein DMG97_41160 [Acidobacteria bacterium]|nr:MAG: hypothetical protein DMG97_41160 [Acidobacteriota bacterium]